MVKSKMKHPALFVICFILCLLSLVPAVAGSIASKSLFATPEDLNSVTPENAYEGKIVSGEIYASYGTFGQLYKTDENGNIISEDDMIYYYLFPSNLTEENYAITLATDDTETISNMNMLSTATYNFLTGQTDTIENESVEFTGMLIAMNDDELEHLYSWIINSDIFTATTAEEAAEGVLPYKVTSYNRAGAMPLVIGGCVGFVVFAILSACLMKNRINVNEHGDIVEENEIHDDKKGKKEKEKEDKKE